jgi:acetyl-CoA synthetase
MSGRNPEEVEMSATDSLTEGQQPSDELADEIKGFVRGNLSAYAYPRRVEFVDELPKTLTGKIRRIELREAERQQVR